jgi:hypothetical protein
MVSSNDDYEFTFGTETTSRSTYSPVICSDCESTQCFQEPSDYNDLRAIQDLCCSPSTAAIGPIYRKQSTLICESPEIQKPPLNLSITSGTIDSSRRVSYLNHDQTAFAHKWPSGLGINPSFVGDHNNGFILEVNDTTSGKENKQFPVDGSANIPESQFSNPTFSSSYFTDLIENPYDEG